MGEEDPDLAAGERLSGGATFRESGVVGKRFDLAIEPAARAEPPASFSSRTRRGTDRRSDSGSHSWTFASTAQVS